MIRRAVVWALVAATLVVIAASGGCGVNDDGPPLVGTYESGVSSSADGSGACSSAPLPAPQDPSKLPSCCTTGPAHCVPAAQVVPSLTSQLAMCSGGYCEPDDIIQDPEFVPAQCTAFNGTPGACISLCVPQVQQYLSVLKQGTCAADERCAPCINPLDNSNTGACDVGKNNQCGGDSGASEGGGAAMCPVHGGLRSSTRRRSLSARQRARDRIACRRLSFRPRSNPSS